MSEASEQAGFQGGHIPDYIVIGQMLDNPEKVPLDPASNEETSEDLSALVASNAYTLPPPQYLPPASQASFQTSPASSSTRHIQPINTNKFERFTIPTKADDLSSGFPYDPRVYDLISQDDWHDLVLDIIKAAKLSVSEDLAAWSTGVTTGTLSAPFLLVAAPWAGYYAGRAVHRKTVIKNVQKRLGREGKIRAVLRQWNEEKFKAQGFEVWLEVPIDGGEVPMQTESSEKVKQSRKEKKAGKEAVKKAARRFKIVIVRGIRVGQESYLKRDKDTGIQRACLKNMQCAENGVKVDRSWE